MANPHSAALYVGSNHGNNSLFQGSAPGTAGAASMSGGAVLAPGPFQPGSFQPRRVVNQTIGKQTNHSVPVWSIAKRFKNGWEHYFQKGQFMFMRVSEPPSFDRSRLDTLFNLPLLNYYLAQLSLYWESKDQTKRAVEVAAEFVPHGVVLSVNGESASGSSRRGNGEMMVNCTVAGEADTFTVWGNDLRDGDRLYWLYKQVWVQGEMDFSLDFDGSTHQVDLLNKNKPTLVWQVVPYVCKTGLETEPPRSVLCDGNYGEPHGEEATPRMGYARYAGRVQHARRIITQNVNHDRSSVSHLHKMVNRSQMTIFIDL